MRYLIYLFIFISLGFTAACSKKSPSSEKNPLVIVSVSPYDTFVKSIAGDTLDVRVAVPANYNPHLFEPTPKQMEGFQRATIWFGIGEPFEETILRSLKSYDNRLVSVDLSESIPFQSYEEEDLTINSCGASHHHHHDEGVDRHFWMSPYLSSLQVEKITEALIKLFPQHTELYKKNLTQLQKNLEILDKETFHALERFQDHAIIVSHPSLGYFCKDYHLIQISIECEGKTPLPSDLKKILSLSEKYPVLCVFTQEQFDNKGALTIAKRLNLPVYSINPNDPNYFDNIKALAKDISQTK
jgi:zinc transport system substrate-binding protein